MAKKKEIALKVEVSKRLKNILKTVVIVLGTTVGSVLLAITFFHFVFYQRIFPQIWVGNVYVSGLTKNEALEQVTKSIPTPSEIKINYQDESFTINLSSAEFSYDLPCSIDKAYNIERNYRIPQNIIFPLKLVLSSRHLPIVFNLNEETLSSQIAEIGNKINKEAVRPSVSLVNGELVVEKGVPGEILDENLLTKTIKENLAVGNSQPISVDTVFDNTQLSQEEANKLVERAQNLLGKSLVLEFEDYSSTYSKNTLFSLLNGKGGYEGTEIEQLITSFSASIERDPQNPVFVFTNNVVQEFAPAKNGVKVVKDQFQNQVIEALGKLEETAETIVLVNPEVVETKPQYQTSEVNNLGIKELLGKGTSKFVGSIPSRIFNVNLAASKFNGVIIAPGDTLSFNGVLGDVSSATGYQQAYIIKEGATILGDGGGVCQVSTTFFRAALKAGLPIIERRAHAYRVGYYEQDSPPGLDATVYSPSPDLKIKNDTPAHLLIQTRTNTQAKTLTFEIYGTSDGRVATTTKPTVKDVTAPPEDLYTDDPTLPAGQIKQIDWKAWGAKVSFKYTVTRNNEVIYEKTFNSTYQPWQAKYLRGTGPN